jgi:hypothetical protein
MANFTLKIESIICQHTSDLDGVLKDEVWLFYQPDGGVPVRYPYGAIKTNSMAAGDVWTLGQPPDNPEWPPLEVSFDYDLQITLWEQDHALDISTTDFLGSFCFTGAESGSADVSNGDSSKYTITWSGTSNVA